jgi:uncharacterized protein
MKPLMCDNQTRLPRYTFWRRLDTDGLDACAIYATSDGYSIKGTAIFTSDSQPTKMDYMVVCDHRWTSRSAVVHGVIGNEDWNCELYRDSMGYWISNGSDVEGSEGWIDIDLGFTPATNILAVKRLALETGMTARTTALWLDPDDWTFKPLVQTYCRKSAHVYTYASPAHCYEADLKVDEFGMVQIYPGLWAQLSAVQ